MILSIADRRAAQARSARLRSMRPYCGPCFDSEGDINDLVPIKLWGREEAVMGHYCPCCGAEFA